MQNILTKPAVFAGLLFILAVASATYYFSAESVDSTIQPIAENTAEQAENTEEPILITEIEVKKNFEAEEKDPYKLAEAALDGGLPGERLRSVLMLRGQFTKESVRLLSQFLNDQDISIVEETMDALAYVGINGGLQAEVFAILKEKALDPAFMRRGTALVTASIVMKGQPDEVLPLIDGFIAADEEDMNLFAARALNYIDDPKALPMVQKLLSVSRDNDVARNCFHMAARMNSPEAAALLASYVNSDDPYLQKHAVHALGLNNSDVYKKMLADAISTGTMRHDSIGYLAVTESAADVFGNAMSNPATSKETKLSLLKDIGEYTTNSPKEEWRNEILEKAIKPALNSGDPELIKQGLGALEDARAGIDEGAQAAAEHTGSNDPELVKAALNALVPYMHPRNAKLFEPMFYNEDQYIRRFSFSVAQGFMQQNNPEHKEMIENALKNSDDPFIKEHAQKLLDNTFGGSGS